MSEGKDRIALDKEHRAAALKLAANAAARLHDLRPKAALIRARDETTRQEARRLAQDVIASAVPLDLRLLVACAQELLHFADQCAASSSSEELDAPTFLLDALDTLGMEVERLKHDGDLR